MAFMDDVVRLPGGVKIGARGQIRSPSTYQVESHDIDLDSKRAITGVLDKNPVRYGDSAAHTVTLSWEWLSKAEFILLKSSTAAPELEIEYYDPRPTGDMQTGRFYRDANMTWVCKQIRTPQESYWSISMALVEY